MEDKNKRINDNFVKNIEAMIAQSDIQKGYSKGGAIYDVSTSSYFQEPINAEGITDSINSNTGIDTLEFQ